MGTDVKLSVGIEREPIEEGGVEKRGGIGPVNNRLRISGPKKAGDKTKERSRKKGARDGGLPSEPPVSKSRRGSQGSPQKKGEFEDN